MEVLDFIAGNPVAIVLTVFVAAFLYSLYVACTDVTGSTDLLRFFFNKSYWSCAVFYHNYNKALAKGQNFKEFKAGFWENFVAPFSSRGSWRKLSDSDRSMMIKLLCSEDFVETYFTRAKAPAFSYAYYKTVIAAWEKYLVNGKVS